NFPLCRGCVYKHTCSHTHDTQIAFKCREVWTSLELERAFNLGLDAGLLLIPIFIMSFAYSLIVTKLWRGMRHEIQHNFKDSLCYIARDTFGFLIIFVNTNSLTLVETDSAKLCFLYGNMGAMCANDAFPTIDKSHTRVTHLPRTTTYFLASHNLYH
ncbi:hypothetical protein SFRURICE_000456, partial [Spodoptera frugiperda]